jgi:hypothetical protein
MAYGIRRSGFGTLAHGTLRQQGNKAPRQQGGKAIGTLAHGTLRQQGNKAPRQQGSKAIRQKAKGNKAIRQQGIMATRQQGSKALRQQGIKASGHLLSTRPAAQTSCKCFPLIRKAANLNVAVLRHGQPSLFLR